MSVKYFLTFIKLYQKYIRKYVCDYKLYDF